MSQDPADRPRSPGAGPTPRRAVLGGTAAVAAFALGLQLALVLTGAAALLPEQAPPLPVALVRLVSYFTIQSNLLVLLGCAWLVLRPRGGRVLDWVRAASLMGIVVTGLVHWFLLRPLLDLTGARALADTLLHVVVPLLAVLGWVLVGPRPRIGVPLAAGCLLWPVLWTAATLLVGGLTGWYPYPFLDVGARGAGPVAVTCLGITVGFVVVLALLVLADRRLPVPLGDRDPTGPAGPDRSAA